MHVGYNNIVLDLAITYCFFVFHEIVEYPRIVQKLVVYFLVEGNFPNHYHYRQRVEQQRMRPGVYLGAGLPLKYLRTLSIACIYFDEWHCSYWVRICTGNEMSVLVTTEYMNFSKSLQ